MMIESLKGDKGKEIKQEHKIKNKNKNKKMQRHKYRSKK